jgi:hypothetical protein
MNMHKEFLNLANLLNTRLNIIPLLYGSLGLQKRTGIFFHPKDIDILIPELYITEKWNELKIVIENDGYQLIDLHEHEFSNKNYIIAFSFIEDLKKFANIEIKSIEIIIEKEIRYYLLSERQYLDVYTQSSKDSYRNNKNKLLKERLKNSKMQQNQYL